MYLTRNDHGMTQEANPPVAHFRVSSSRPSLAPRLTPLLHSYGSLAALHCTTSQPRHSQMKSDSPLALWEVAQFVLSDVWGFDSFRGVQEQVSTLLPLVSTRSDSCSENGAVEREHETRHAFLGVEGS